MGRRNAAGILWMLAASFVAMAVEVRYLHRSAVSEKPVAWIGFAACVVAVVAALFVQSKAKAMRGIGSALLVAVALCGLAGFYFHTELKPERVTVLFTNKTLVDTDEDEGKGESEERSRENENSGSSEQAPPPLAPLALTGLAVVGLLAMPSRGRQP